MKLATVKNLTLVIILTLIAAFGVSGCDSAKEEQPAETLTIDEPPAQIIPIPTPEPTPAPAEIVPATDEPPPAPVVEVPTPTPEPEPGPQPECATDEDCGSDKACTEGKCVITEPPPNAPVCNDPDATTPSDKAQLLTKSTTIFSNSDGTNNVEDKCVTVDGKTYLVEGTCNNNEYQGWQYDCAELAQEMGTSFVCSDGECVKLDIIDQPPQASVNDILKNASGKSYFVAPPELGGLNSGDGTIEHPLDIKTVLGKNSPVKPGETVWLRGGTYVGNFESYLKGGAEHPIVVRAFPGERPILDSGGKNNGPTLIVQIAGGYTWFWGLEIKGSPAKRYSYDLIKDDNIEGEDLKFGMGVLIWAEGTKFINCIIHDTLTGFDTHPDANKIEINGCLLYNNGYQREFAPIRGGGHGIYLQNNFSPGVSMVNSVIANGFGWGVHAYGAAKASGQTSHLTIKNCHIFNNGVWAHHQDDKGPFSGLNSNIHVGGGYFVALDINIIGNYTWYPTTVKEAGSNVLGKGYKGVAGLTCRANVWVAGNNAMKLYLLDANAAAALPPYPDPVSIRPNQIVSNTFIGPVDFKNGNYPNNKYYADTKPKGTQIAIVPYDYGEEIGGVTRAHISIYNWDHLDKVLVDEKSLAPVLAPGSWFEIRDSQNFFAEPVLKGKYKGGSIQLPMAGLNAVKPLGELGPVAAGQEPHNVEFNTFVLLPLVSWGE